MPTADDLDVNGQYIVDGTLLPCWSWANRPILWSGKHSTTGVNVQVACDLRGRLVWISDPVDGHRHDIAGLRANSVLEGMNPKKLVRRQRLHRPGNDHHHPKESRPHPRRGTPIQ
ncbi:transposase family protein [Rathayibacter rathayi]|uniref:transposase family protein n=1 Tax=Rathayibacter rathayi TaxID=33887 RepID=UPI003B96C9FA